jgi:hypothetical protein
MRTFPLSNARITISTSLGNMPLGVSAVTLQNRERGREREWKRETERKERKKERQRQTDTERETETKTDREADIHTERETSITICLLPSKNTHSSLSSL